MDAIGRSHHLSGNGHQPAASFNGRIARANILGVGVSAINMAIALETVERWIAERESHYVCITSVHGVMESQRDVQLRRIHNVAGMVTPDGMPLV